MHTNFGGVLRKAEISETFVTREVRNAQVISWREHTSRQCLEHDSLDLGPKRVNGILLTQSKVNGLELFEGDRVSCIT